MVAERFKDYVIIWAPTPPPGEVRVWTGTTWSVDIDQAQIYDRYGSAFAAVVALEASQPVKVATLPIAELRRLMDENFES